MATFPNASNASFFFRSSAAAPWRFSRTLPAGTSASLPSADHFSLKMRPSVSSSSSSPPQSVTLTTVASSHSPRHLPSTTMPSWNMVFFDAVEAPRGVGLMLKMNVPVSSSSSEIASLLNPLNTESALFGSSTCSQNACRTSGTALIEQPFDISTSCNSASVRARSSALPIMWASSTMYSMVLPQSFDILCFTEPPLPIIRPLALPST
mmetsp:Transcript_49808/g.98868  ORF Transcript_49808/g.98868 Transcript_49808/m.98868 type:complete len:208 (+) Transcript_49808:2149-2772(+)